MGPVLNSTSSGIQYGEITYPELTVYSVISDLDIQLLKWEVNSIDSRILNEIIDKILELGRLEENWDSYGSAPISEEAITKAHFFIIKTTANDSLTTSRPFVSPEPNGGVILKWRAKDQEFLIWFIGGGVWLSAALVAACTCTYMHV